MIAENPGPDNDTMETLIETNEQLSKAMNQHQRAVLNARKIAGVGNGEVAMPPSGPPPRTESGFAAPPAGPPPILSKPTPPNRKAVKNAPQIPPPGDYVPNLSDDDEVARNPFADPEKEVARPGLGLTAAKPKLPFPADQPPVAKEQFNDRLGIEPYHPGFRETNSYVGRQDSSLGNATMHAGATLDADYEKQVVDPQPTDGSSSAGGYGAQGGVKAPVYRY